MGIGEPFYMLLIKAFYFSGWQAGKVMLRAECPDIVTSGCGGGRGRECGGRGKECGGAKE